MDSTKFDQQPLYRLTDVAALFTSGNVPKARLHLENGYIPCSQPTTAPGVPSMFTQEDLLTCGVFYELITKRRLYQEHAARIAKRIPPGTWQDVRDGFTKLVQIRLDGEGKIVFGLDLREMEKPAVTSTLIIDLQAVRQHVIERVDLTWERRRNRDSLE